jgi:hypothetical protein
LSRLVLGGQYKTRFRGTRKVGRMFTLAAAACNLVRLPKLLGAVAQQYPESLQRLPCGGILAGSNRKNRRNYDFTQNIPLWVSPAGKHSRFRSSSATC